MTYKPVTPAQRDEEFSERAAIIEYEGGYPRKEAEEMARRILGPRPKKDTPSTSSSHLVDTCAYPSVGFKIPTPQVVWGLGEAA